MLDFFLGVLGFLVRAIIFVLDIWDAIWRLGGLASVRLGLIVNVAGSDAVIARQQAESAGKRLGVNLVSAEVREPNDLDTAFEAAPHRVHLLFRWTRII
jgi:hypothetical protein